ncbi:MAG: DUF2092 domain-containing protein [Methyloprofundus sp.]|nr:DUF2092 domain-containing protein [Methyloprofundus sp.]
MTLKNAISVLILAGVTASCSTVVTDKPVTYTPDSDSQNKRVAAKTVDEYATAIQAMDEMSSYLRSLKKFTVTADVSFDEVLDNGQKVLLDKLVDIRVEMPSKLWAKSSTYYNEKEFYFNGETFTLYTPNLGYFASFDMPATIGQLAIKANQKYAIEIPIVDLFLWGTAADSSVTAVEEARIIGVDNVNGVSCNHFAFRAAEIDWQICIQRDGTPLPLKLVITEKNVATQPQHITILTWNTSPDLNAQNYTFTPHDGDQEISFSKVNTDK